MNIVFDCVPLSTTFTFKAARRYKNGEGPIQYNLKWDPVPGDMIHALVAEFDESKAPKRHRILLVSKTEQDIKNEKEFALFNWGDTEACRHRYSLSDKTRLNTPVRFRCISVPFIT